MPSDYALDLYRGDTHRWQFRLWADAAKTSPVDLTAATVKSEIHAQGSNALIASLACTVALPNTIDVVLSATESAKLTTPPARWDLQLTWANGDIQTPVAGAVIVKLDATV